MWPGSNLVKYALIKLGDSLAIKPISREEQLRKGPRMFAYAQISVLPHQFLFLGGEIIKDVL